MMKGKFPGVLRWHYIPQTYRRHLYSRHLKVINQQLTSCRLDNSGSIPKEVEVARTPPWRMEEWCTLITNRLGR